MNHNIYNKYNLFNQTLNQYERDGIDIESKLKEDYEIKIINENNEEIDNALRYVQLRTGYNIHKYYKP